LTVWDRGFDAGNFAMLTVLSLIVFLLLPRQFHVAVVENHTGSELKRARWLFPLYLILINLFVIPIALAGIIIFGASQNADDFVLILPMSQGGDFVSLLAFIGGLSAGTAMVVVACVALAIMISNDLVLPFYLRSQASSETQNVRNMEIPLLNIRRAAIVAILTLAYLYYSFTDNSVALASIGLISFVAIAQLGPAFFGGLVWKRATANGAIIGMVMGFSVWAYTLLMPTFLSSDHTLISQGLFGISGLRPQSLFGFEFTSISNGMFWSLFFNLIGYVFGSLAVAADPLERMQASQFVSYSMQSSRTSWNDDSEVTVVQLRETVARYLGHSRTNRAFEDHWNVLGQRPDDVSTIDNDLLRFSEQLLASAVGASSSRLVHSLLLKRYDKKSKVDIRLLDEATEALQFNAGVLQSALDQLDQGITVFDNEFRLASWNSQFRKLLNLPVKIGKAGTPLSQITLEVIQQNGLADADPDGEILAEKLVNSTEPWHLELNRQNKIIEISTAEMPAGGVVVTWSDITLRVRSAAALIEANETLERRVEERTSDLVNLNEKLKLATEEADTANRSKTRFLAAAGHDILQPLNAARLYSSTLLERLEKNDNQNLIQNVGKSLESVEDILGAILAISRLDTVRFEAQHTGFPLQSILDQLELEFRPVALEKKLKLKFYKSDDWVFSDPTQLRRLLQNLISNAIKYTVKGSVKIRCGIEGGQLAIKIVDTGIGIKLDDQKLIFTEFERLDEGKRQAPGLGLGLSIVERISNLLGHTVTINSAPNIGTTFEVFVPLASASNDNEIAEQLKPLKNLKSFKGGNVLCLDNDADILDGMSALLTQWGCKVMTAKDLETAMVAARNSPELPYIILADYHLDHGNGIDAVLALRKELGEIIPAILVTADRSIELKKRAGTYGIPILHKPVKPAALRAIMAQEGAALQAAE